MGVVLDGREQYGMGVVLDGREQYGMGVVLDRREQYGIGVVLDRREYGRHTAKLLLQQSRYYCRTVKHQFLAVNTSRLEGPSAQRTKI